MTRKNDEIKSQKVRTITSCIACRKRKVKCDKERPSCKNCLSRKVHCQYQQQNWSNITVEAPLSNSAKPTINKSIEQSVLKPVVGPTIEESREPDTEINDDDTEIDFYASTFATPITFSHGALTWVSMLRKDRFMNVLVLSHIFKSILLKAQKYNREEKMQEIPIEFVNKWNRALDLDNIEDKLNCKTSYLNSATKLFSEIKKHLNNSKLVWASIECFFKSGYCLIFPYINETEFIEELITLIGPPNYTSEPINLKITKVEQLSIIGTLLVMMKFISISGYNFGKPLSNIDTLTQFILDNPVDQKDGPSIYSIILRIYQEVTSLRLHSLHIFQFICMKFSYELYSPEEQDCLTIANGSKLGELYQYAIQCSLNRDPDFKNALLLKNSVQNKNLSRRLWYMVVFWDLFKFVDIGYPPLIDESFYNTKLPKIEDSSTEIEKVINTSIKERMEFYNNVKPILKLILNMKQNPTISKIKSEVEKINKLVQEIPTLDDIMKHPCETLSERCDNFKHLMFLLQSHSMLFIVHYHLFIHYNERQNVKHSVDYLIKSIKIAKVIFKSLLFMDPRAKDYSLQKHFGPAALTFPRIEASVHKISILFLSILSRIKAFKLMKGVYIDSEKLVILDSMADVIHTAFSYMMRQYIGASNVYYHTWIASKLNITVAYKILSVPKGPFLQNDYTDEDVNFKQSLERTATVDNDEKLGDLGFEKYSCEDLKKVLDEMTSLINVVNLNVADSSPPTQQEPFTKKRKTFSDSDINNNDSKWFDKMFQDFGHNQTNRVDALQSLQDDLLLNNFNSNSLHMEGLNSLINGTTLDDLFNHGIDSFFGFGESGSYI